MTSDIVLLCSWVLGSGGQDGHGRDDRPCSLTPGVSSAKIPETRGRSSFGGFSSLKYLALGYDDLRAEHSGAYQMGCLHVEVHVAGAGHGVRRPGF